MTLIAILATLILIIDIHIDMMNNIKRLHHCGMQLAYGVIKDVIMFGLPVIAIWVLWSQIK